MFARRTDTNAVEVIARFVNCTKNPIQLDARSSFMDGAQLPTEDTSSWKRVYVPPFATGVYKEVSLARDNVSYYLVELKGGD